MESFLCAKDYQRLAFGFKCVDKAKHIHMKYDGRVYLITC